MRRLLPAGSPGTRPSPWAGRAPAAGRLGFATRRGGLSLARSRPESGEGRHGIRDGRPPGPQVGGRARPRRGVRLPGERGLGDHHLGRLRRPGARRRQGVDRPRRGAGHRRLPLRHQRARVGHLRPGRHGRRGPAGRDLPDEHRRGMRLHPPPLGGEGALRPGRRAPGTHPRRAVRTARPSSHRDDGPRRRGPARSAGLGPVRRRRPRSPRRRRRREGGRPRPARRRHSPVHLGHHRPAEGGRAAPRGPGLHGRGPHRHHRGGPRRPGHLLPAPVPHRRADSFRCSPRRSAATSSTTSRTSGAFWRPSRRSAPPPSSPCPASGRSSTPAPRGRSPGSPA